MGTRPNGYRVVMLNEHSFDYKCTFTLYNGFVVVAVILIRDQFTEKRGNQFRSLKITTRLIIQKVFTF